MNIEQKTLPEQHYLYVSKTVRFDEPGAIGNAMGSAFGEVFGFAGQNGIQPQSMPISVYIDMPADGQMTFRGGIFVSEADAAKAEGDVKAGVIPAGEAVTTTHVGSYASLNVSHQALWSHIEQAGLTPSMPVWEVYVDDPTTLPEDQVKTEIFRKVG